MGRVDCRAFRSLLGIWDWILMNLDGLTLQNIYSVTEAWSVQADETKIVRYLFLFVPLVFVDVLLVVFWGP